MLDTHIACAVCGHLHHAEPDDGEFAHECSCTLQIGPVPFLGIMPAIDPIATNRCLEALDPLIRDRIVLVDNSTAGFDTPSTGWKIQAFRNLGVARSWNIGARMTLEHADIEQLWLMSTSVTQHDGGWGWINQMDRADETALGVAHLGWHLHGFRRSVFERVGLFDEHFYPAYYEDTDFLYRMDLAGLDSPRENSRSWPYVFIDADYAGDAQAMKLGLVPRGDEAHQYYIRKWGGDQGHETFRTPFDSGRSWSWCP